MPVIIQDVIIEPRDRRAECIRVVFRGILAAAKLSTPIFQLGVGAALVSLGHPSNVNAYWIGGLCGLLVQYRLGKTWGKP